MLFDSYTVSVKTRIAELLQKHNGPMITEWIITSGYLEIQAIYEEEFIKIHKADLYDRTLDKLWISIKNIVYAIQAYYTLFGEHKLIDFVSAMIEFQMSSFYSDFEEVVAHTEIRTRAQAL